MEKSWEKPKNMYKDWSRMILNGFNECLEMGWTKEAASGMALTDVEHAENTGPSLERKIIYFHLCYLFAKEDVREAFNRVYPKMEKEFGTTETFKLNDVHEELKLFKEEIEEKEKLILEYAKR